MPALVADRGFPEEPAFCVETALKCLYLSLHAYSRSKVGRWASAAVGAPHAGQGPVLHGPLACASTMIQ